MKSNRNDDDAPTLPVPLVSAPRDAAEPNDAPRTPTGAGADDAQAHRRDGDPEAATSPEPIDIERLILSLDRTPIPPAPTPDERPMSNGGRFVAYHATGQPAQPHTEQEARRRALGGLSVLVNSTPVPRALSLGDGTGPMTPPSPRTGSGVWLGAAVIAATFAFASLIAMSGSHEPKRSAVPTPLVDPVAPIASSPVVELTSIDQATAPRETREAATTPSALPARSSSTRTAPPGTIARPPAASTDVLQPKKSLFEDW